MMGRRFLYIILFSLFLLTEGFCQDTSFTHQGKYLMLKEIVLQKGLDVPSFLMKLKDDTSFYKAFKLLRTLNYKAINDIRMLDRKGNVKAYLKSNTEQKIETGCRTMQVLETTHYGDFYEKDGAYNYYTASLYAALFFTKGKICGESDIVGNTFFDVNNKRGMERHKEQLKMLFFNPGVSVPGIPFIGEKITLDDPQVMKRYDMLVDYEVYNGEPAFLFHIKMKAGLPFYERNKVVIDEMRTWFAQEDFAVLGRVYQMKYATALYDFDVAMEVEMKRFDNKVVPSVLRYNGNWDLPFRKREHGMFTATLYDFKR